MEQTKIQSLTPQGTYNTKEGKLMYKSDVVLENGMIGQVSSATIDRWSVGQDVVVKSHTQTNYGPRLSLDRPGYGGGAPSGPRPMAGETEKRIKWSWAIKTAVQSLPEDVYDADLVKQRAIALNAMMEELCNQ